MANSIFPGDSDRRVFRNISFQANRLARQRLLPGVLNVDIEQDLILDLLIRARAYDPRRAGFTTFADRVVAHRLADLTRGSAKLTAERATLSLEQADRDGTPLIEILPDRAPPVDEDVGLRLDLQRFSSELPAELIRCCEALHRGDVVGDAADVVGVHRSTFHDRLRKLRLAATSAGLGAYLNRPDGPAPWSVCGREDNPSMEALRKMTDAQIKRGEVPLDARALSQWVATAKPGALVAYYRGSIAYDVPPDVAPVTGNTRKLRAVARLLWAEHERDRVLLVQRRLGDRDYLYFAVRSTRHHRSRR